SSSFASLTSARVMIAPGCHDPVSVDSCYQNFTWPSNVFSFPSGSTSFIEFNDKLRGTSDRDYVYSGGRETGRKGIRVYGAAFEGHFARKSMLVSEDGRTPRLSLSYVNVLVMYGNLVKDGGKSVYNPIPVDVLNECGFDICAIGGAKTYSKKGNIISPGTICPGGFDNTGDCGVVVCEITSTGRLITDFIPINVIRYEKVTFDVTGRDDMSAGSIASAIEKLIRTPDCCMIEIVGELNYDENIDVIAIGNAVKALFPLTEVVDSTVKKADLLLFNSENTFRGLYTASIWDSVKKAREEQKNALGETRINEKNYEQAVNIGLKMFDGMYTGESFSSLKEAMAKKTGAAEESAGEQEEAAEETEEDLFEGLAGEPEEIPAGDPFDDSFDDIIVETGACVEEVQEP
ncbi:MAG: hypothetical protein J6112_08345, partial [Clostridia bacterium]|nr:hypothetical protein [Clostridia bacterium]